MPLDAQTKAILDNARQSGAPALYELPVAEARAALKEMTRALDIEKTAVHRREERMIPDPAGDIPVRIYWPRAAEPDALLGVLVNIHGGGFALGDLDSHENTSRYYCTHGGVIVVSVGYRLSPEFKFPTGLKDCEAALCWVADHATEFGGDPQRIAIMGDSAGGNLSAVLCQIAKARGGPAIKYQILVYPVVDLDPNADYRSRKAFGGGDYFLSLQDMIWLNSMYFETPEEGMKDPRASPILTQDLAGLPPALIITAGYDPLADEGADYAARLRAAGVACEHVCFESTIHGFMAFAGAIDAGARGLALVAQRLKEKLG
ncbi:MAG: alpha/beta hydrolase [Pseudomonadota bacterium]